MSSPAILAISVVYLCVGLDKLCRGETGLAVAFLGYAFSNVGLYLAAK